MKKNRKVLSVVSLLLIIAFVFAACGNNGNKNGINDSKVTEAPSTEIQTTEPQKKYSKNDKLIAMTFDDGPYSKTTNRILDTLEKNGGKATFFVVGYNLDGNEETLKRAIDMGCEIGNHSKDHKNLTKISAEERKNQIRTPNIKLKEITGAEPKLFRAPGGNYKNVTDEIGMPLIQWSIDTNDWRHKDASNKGRSAEQRTKELNQIAENVFAQAESGDIILMHDIYEFTADLCEIVIPGLVSRGFKLVTVSEMFDAYDLKLENGNVYNNAQVSTVEPAAAIDAGSYKVKTSGSILNMRAKPDINSEVLAKLPNGSKVEVMKSEIGWAYVTWESSQGWVNSAYLEKTTV